MSSFIQIPSDKLTEICNRSLAAIKELREARTKSVIASYVKELNNGFLHKLFKCEPITEQEASKILVNGTGDNHPYSYVYWRQEFFSAKTFLNENIIKAYNLLRMARNGNPVNVSSEDLNDLWPGLNKKGDIP
jgi:hypothetical protein